MSATRPSLEVPEGLSLAEARFVLEALSRAKARRFARLVISISDARMVDVETSERVDRDTLKALGAEEV